MSSAAGQVLRPKLQQKKEKLLSSDNFRYEIEGIISSGKFSSNSGYFRDNTAGE